MLPPPPQVWPIPTGRQGIVIRSLPLAASLASTGRWTRRQQRRWSKIFLEVIIAPGYAPEALEILKSKKDLRILQSPPLNTAYLQSGFDLKKVVGGLLIQNRDLGRVPMKDWKVVTKRKPTEEELRAMAFGWRVAKHVKSNAIVLVREDRTIGIGAGQMSRVDSTRLAVMKAQSPTKGTVLASDAMFPFRDGVDTGSRGGCCGHHPARRLHPGR